MTKTYIGTDKSMKGDEPHVQTDECGFDRNGSISEDRYVCMCGWRDDDTLPFEGHTVVANDDSLRAAKQGGTHTRGKLAAECVGSGGAYDNPVDVYQIVTADGWKRVAEALSEGDARRLVACWNACLPMSTALLERSGDLVEATQTLERSLSSALECLRNLSNAITSLAMAGCVDIEQLRSWEEREAEWHTPIRDAEAIIAKHSAAPTSGVNK